MYVYVIQEDRGALSNLSRAQTRQFEAGAFGQITRRRGNSHDRWHGREERGIEGRRKASGSEGDKGWLLIHQDSRRSSAKVHVRSAFRSTIRHFFIHSTLGLCGLL